MQLVVGLDEDEVGLHDLLLLLLGHGVVDVDTHQSWRLWRYGQGEWVGVGDGDRW